MGSTSTPMLTLPMERLFKPLVRNAGVADDSKLDEAIGSRVHSILGEGRCFREAEFFEAGEWFYIEATNKFPVSEAWPCAVLDQLTSEQACAAAGAAPAADILSCLRNALSHGGVVYLDKYGRQSEDATHMLGFASYPSLSRQDKLRILRVSVKGYRCFLTKWTRWLTASGVVAKLEHEGPAWYDAEVAVEQRGSYYQYQRKARR